MVQVTEQYFATLPDSTAYLSYVAVYLPGEKAFIATTWTPFAEVGDNRARAQRITREILIDDIVKQMKERLFGA